MKRRCPTHDAPSPRVIAELERDTGINPQAVAELEQDDTLSFTDRYANPRLVDCGNRWCKNRR